MPKWMKTKYPGVRYREHPTRMHGRQPDRYYVLNYKLDGKTKDEAVGWASEGVKPSECARLYGELKENRRKGEGPRSLAEKRELEKRARKADEQHSMSLDAYWANTYAPFAEKQKKASSWKRELSLYTVWIAPLLGKVPLRELDLPHWDRLVRKLDKAGRSQRTKEYATGTLRRVLKHAYERGLIPNPPPSGKRVGVTPPKNNRRERVIRSEEMQEILSVLQFEAPKAHKLTLFAWLTGCRLGEAIKLRWKDVDLKARTLTFRDTKNKDSRTLPVQGELLALLKNVSEKNGAGFVFTNERGRAYKSTPTPFRNTVKKLGLNDGREENDKIVFHSIRHSVATELAKHLNPSDLMEVMGWKTVEMVMRYVHGDKTAQQKALVRLGNALHPKDSGYDNVTYLSP